MEITAHQLPLLMAFESGCYYVAPTGLQPQSPEFWILSIHVPHMASSSMGSEAQTLALALVFPDAFCLLSHLQPFSYPSLKILYLQEVSRSVNLSYGGSHSLQK